MKTRTARVLVLLLLSLGLTGCYEAESRVIQTVDRSWDAAEIDVLNLETVNGRVEVFASSSKKILVRAEIKSSRRTEENVVRFTTEEGVLKVRERWPRAKGILPFKRGSGGSVRYEIEVPEKLILDIGTTNGRIETSGVRGDQSLSSVNGRIEIDTPDAEVEARTVNGRIEARFHQAFHRAELKTVNGSVKVFVPAGTKVAADVDQVNGSFNSRLPVVVNSRGAEGAALRVTTVNGSVTLDEIEPAEPTRERDAS